MHTHCNKTPKCSQAYMLNRITIAKTWLYQDKEKCNKKLKFTEYMYLKIKKSQVLPALCLPADIHKFPGRF
jgi:hypothetical protein